MLITELGERFIVQEDLVSTEEVRLSLARDTETKRMVLLRELVQLDSDPGFRERLQREADVLEKLKSPLIPKLLGVYQDGDAYYLARNYPGGVCLRDFREKNQEIVLAQTERWMNEFIDELEMLHELEPSYVVGRFSADDFIVSPTGNLLFLPVRLDTVRPADLMDDKLNEGDKGDGESATPKIVDVHNVIRLIWWLLTGEAPLIGRPPAPLQKGKYEEITSVWLKGIEKAVDPIFPRPPQTCGELRALLLGQVGGAGTAVVSPPKLEYEVGDLKFLNGPSGRVAQGILSLKNVGGGELRGYSRSTQRWARVVPNTFEGNEIDLQFWIDPTGMKASEEHHANIYLVTQNQEVTVPVEVKTAPHIFSRMPDLFAVIAVILPSILLTLFVFFSLYFAQQNALHSITQLAGDEIPLYLLDSNGIKQTDQLNPELLTKMIPPTDPVVSNAKVAVAVTLGACAVCPIFVYLISHWFPVPQRKRLMLFEFFAMLGVLLLCLLNWLSPTLNPVCAQHPNFTVLAIKPFFWKYWLLTIGWSLAQCYLVQLLIEKYAPGKEETVRKALQAVMSLISIWIIGGVIIG